jgi:uncharacterized protein (TIGR02598 family)
LSHNLISQEMNKSNGRAFSLVETVLALGILGLAITALLGLLPHGIEMTRQAANISAVSRIVGNISSELSLFQFSELRSGSARISNLAFDDQGSKIIGGQTFQSYLAEVNISNTGAVIPGSGTPQPQMIIAVINVAATPNPGFVFNPAAPNTYVSIPVILGPVLQR